jgi:NAD(P)-dependent dehydrogenase (short-subunit alcohol dehydrogenase family)
MKPLLKKLEEQVIVLTGASSGIGLLTARAAAERGAKVVLAARNQTALHELVGELRAQGHDAIYVTADVANQEDMDQVARHAVQTFGRIDTWVNNAGVSIYGRLTEVTLEDARRLFETNFWGVVIGSRVAVEHLAQNGGALINIGSTLSDRAFPLQGMYSASKHAVRGFTDALRMELEEEGLPISVTLVKPGAIDTPYTAHAKSYLDVEPTNPPPLYDPQVVADAILQAAQRPLRDVYCGGSARALSVAGGLMPRLTDRIMERLLFAAQRSDRRHGDDRPDALHAPGADGQERGGGSRVFRRSLYTAMTTHSLPTALLGLAALAGFRMARMVGAARRRLR